MEMKAVIVLQDSLPVGLKTNIAGVLGMSLGRYYPELVGDPVRTAAGRELPGITTIPIPILSTDETGLAAIFHATAGAAEGLDLVVPFGEAALSTKTYADYQALLATLDEAEQGVRGLLLFGAKKTVNKLVGQLALLR